MLKPSVENPMAKLVRGHISGKPEEEEKIQQANKRLNVKRQQAKEEGGIIELSEEEEENAVEEGRKALREIEKRFREDRPKKAER